MYNGLAGALNSNAPVGLQTPYQTFRELGRLGVQEFEAMQETIDLFSDIQSSLKQLENGKGIEHSEAKKMLLNRLLRNG